jgi:Uma2 family endonuclease
MNLLLEAAAPGATVYPESDGEPMADNSEQARWLVVLFGNLLALFREAADVLVGLNMFWYPREGESEVKEAPDVFVVFGRPKGKRGSYQQWNEGDVPLTVVFEILSPGNTYQEMCDKFDFYEEYGVEEYYIYDPQRNRLQVYLRKGDTLLRQRRVDGFVSPRLGVRFGFSGPEMAVFYPDGRPFLTFEELEAARAQAERRADQAEQLAEQAERRAEQAERRAARLGELSRKARRGLASAEELQELERLEDQPSSPGTP